MPRLRDAILILGTLAIVACAPSVNQVEMRADTAASAAEYLPQDLRTRVENLKSDVAAKPTDASSVLARLDILWPWANAYALQGWPIDPDLPYYVSVARAPDSALTIDSPRSLKLHQTIDSWVRELALREANPDAIGSLTTSEIGPFTVGTYATLRQVYKVGERPLSPGDGFVVATRSNGGPTEPQTTDPTGDTYMTIRSSRPGVEFEATSRAIKGMFTGVLGGFQLPRPFFRLSKGTLEPGDEVTITIGDTGQGSKGARLGVLQSTALRYRVWLHLANENVLFNLPEIPFLLDGDLTAGVRAFAPSIVKAGEPFELAVRSEDRFRNRATRNFPAYRVRLDGAPFKQIAAGVGAITVFGDLRISQPGVHLFTVESADGLIRGESNPVLVELDPQRRIFWGETHGHSGFAEGVGTVDGFFDFARNDSRLDFVTLSEHDLWMDDFEWESLRRAVTKFSEPGKFETYLGYEWTVDANRGGHHNVLFRTPAARDRIGRQWAPTLPELHRQLAARYDVADVIVLPHAHQPGDWKISDSSLEPFVEMVSNHGTFEWFGRAYLSQGHEVGFLGGSDDHSGHPGLRSLRDTPSSDNFGGLAAIIAPAKSSNAIFDSIRDRAGYATNGFRIILDATMSSSRMGKRTGPIEERKIEGRVIGTTAIEEIVIVKNGSEVHRQGFIDTALGDTDTLELKFFSESQQPTWGAEARTWRRWEGVIDIKGARLISVAAPKNENVHTEYVRVSKDDPNKVEFFLRTRGSTKGVVLQLDGLNEKTQVVLTTRGAQPVAHTFIGADMRSGPEVVVAKTGQYADTVTLRPITTPTERVRSFTWTDPEPFRAGDNYFVRVQQIDGGLAWSSPFWTGGTSPID
ncbi:MAG: DUF3604 domain-containing protein [Alphaproteobacteria bacterium]|nr:DUF3604 domain-containing protein [Alphaproteobacteria bacterium]